MKRLILKTVGITLAVVLGTVVLVFGALTLFNPAAMGELFDACGNYTATVWHYERQYNKTQDFSDLKRLVDKLDEEGDCARTDKYSTLFIVSSEFKAFSETATTSNTMGQLGLCEYYYGKCAIAKAKNQKIDETVIVSKNFVEHLGYTSYNPFKIVIASVGDELTKEQLTTFKTALEGLSIAQAAQDIQDLQLLINAKGE